MRQALLQDMAALPCYKGEQKLLENGSDNLLKKVGNRYYKVEHVVNVITIITK